MSFEQVRQNNMRTKVGRTFRAYKNGQHYLTQDLVPRDAKSMNLYIDTKQQILRLELLNTTAGTHKISRWPSPKSDFNRGAMITCGRLTGYYQLKSQPYAVASQNITTTADKTILNIPVEFWR